jgi:hypothetical protein
MKAPRTEAGRLLLDRVAPHPPDGARSVVDAVRFDAHDELSEMIVAIEGKARRRGAFARYRLEGCEMVASPEGQWVHAEEMGVKEWVLDAPIPVRSIP